MFIHETLKHKVDNVYNVALELCDSCDYFASPLLMEPDALRTFTCAKNQDILATEFCLFTIHLLLC